MNESGISEQIVCKEWSLESVEIVLVQELAIMMLSGSGLLTTMHLMCGCDWSYTSMNM